MRHILGDIVAALEADQPLVLVTIVASEGSSPRGVGASMLVLSDGTQRGTIGGGSVEYAALQRALALFETQGSCIELYRLNTNEVADLGMICGGRVRALFQYIAPNAHMRDIFTRLRDAADAGKQAYLVRRIADGAAADTGALVDGALYGVQSCGEELMEYAATRAVLTEGEDPLLIEPVGSTSRVYLFGGGHVSQKLVPVLAYVDFRVIVLEDRPEFANPALFPAAEDVRLCTFDDFLPAAPVKADDSIVIMTRGHMADYAVLRQALRTDASYIGCIGSRHKIALTKKRLFEEHFTEADFARVHTPIGLPICAETPEEIAISVVAEMIEHRAKH